MEQSLALALLETKSIGDLKCISTEAAGRKGEAQNGFSCSACLHFSSGRDYCLDNQTSLIPIPLVDDFP